MSERPCPIAVLISGGGTTLKNLLEYQSQANVRFDVQLVISSSARAGGLDYARQAGITHRVITKSAEDPSGEAFSKAVFDACDQAGVQYVVMGGFLKLLPIPQRYEDRVINIHPSLIPSFCGQGYYGLRVHQAVLDYGCKISGCTVHLVDNEFDHGPILAQATVPVEDTDTAEVLQQRVFQEECRLYPEVIDRLAGGVIQKRGRWISVVPRES